MQTIKEIDQALSRCLSIEEINSLGLETDTRKGVIKLIEKHNKRIKKSDELREKYKAMQSFEVSTGVLHVAGIDEAGRGPIAGDVVAAAVILNPDFELFGLNDSKQLTENKRMAFRKYIMDNSTYGIGKVTAAEIDQYNIYEATKIAMKRAVEDLSITPQHLLIDAMEIESDIPQTKIIKGDARSVSIAAASVIAKTERDLDMLRVHELYPVYGFDRHKGYGTKEHIEALNQYGATPHHRKTFEPVTSIINKNGYIN